MTALGEFLRACRDRASEEHMGLPSVGSRRVPGLRRQEVAELAAVSFDYLTRLERGRETAPSAQVLESLSAALHLTFDERMHLFRLAGLAPRTLPVSAPSHVEPATLQMMQEWPEWPSLVFDQATDILAMNPVGQALNWGFGSPVNLMTMLFHNQDAFSNWVEFSSAAVAAFRLACGAYPDAARNQAVVKQLLATSPEFERLWQRNEVGRFAFSDLTFWHSRIGELAFTLRTFDIHAAPGQTLVVLRPKPDGVTTEALARLRRFIENAARG